MGSAAVDDRLAYSVPDVARLLDCGETTVQKYVASGELKSFTMSKIAQNSRRPRRMISREALIEFIRAREEKEAANA